MSYFSRLVKKPLFWLFIILCIALYVRLYDINRAVADWHSWRQADTAAVARIFYEDGFNPFVPKYFDMSPVSDNMQVNISRYRFVEFPFYNTLVYIGYLINGEVQIWVARLITVLISLGSVVMIYFIGKRYWGNVSGLLAALVFSILPFSIYYSRVVLPDPMMVFFALGAFYFTDRWIWEKGNKLFILSVFFGAVALLEKPFAVFYLLPLIYSVFLKEKKLFFNYKRYIFWAILTFLPLVLWRLWISQHPEGIPASGWLFNSNGIRFRPSFWRWIIVDRFDKEILSSTGMILLSIGVLIKQLNSKNIILHLLLLSSLLYLIVLSTGNVQHDYYQIVIIPALALFVGRGLHILLLGFPGFINRIFTIPLAIALLIFSVFFTWDTVKGFYQINNDSIVVAGEEADRILPKDAVVLAPWGGDTTFLYYVNRPGFPVIIAPIDEMISKYHVSYFISVNYDKDTNDILNHYEAIEKTPKFVIVDLTKKIN